MLEAFGTVGGDGRLDGLVGDSGAIGGTVEWGHGAVCDGGGRWELAMDVLWGAVGAWW